MEKEELHKERKMKNKYSNLKQKGLKEKSKGITLIALVITIIVLLILAGVSIATLTGENGILTKANEAKIKTTEAGAYEQVQVQALGSIGTDGKINLDELNENLRKNISGLTYKDKVITEKLEDDSENRIESLPAIVVLDGVKVFIADDGDTSIIEIQDGLEIGDTVTYTPDNGTYTWQKEYSGNESDSTLDNKDSYKITTWKVFNINRDGTVDLIAGQPTTGTVYLGNAQGYNNAVKLLNEACDTLYGNKTKGIKGRSINIEDIEGKMTDDALNGENGAHKYKNISSSVIYGTQINSAYDNKMYPIIYAQEKLSVINRKENKNGLGMSEQTKFVESTDGEETSGLTTNSESIQPYQTYWSKNYDFMKSAFQGKGTDTSNVNYNLIMPKGKNTNYWVASRCVSTLTDSCNFLIRYVFNKGVGAFSLYKTKDGNAFNSNPIFPIISVKSSILKENNTAGWKIE